MTFTHAWDAFRVSKTCSFEHWTSSLRVKTYKVFCGPGENRLLYSIFFFTSSGCKDFVLLPLFTLLGEWSHLFSMSKIRCNFQLVLFFFLSNWRSNGFDSSRGIISRRWTNRYSHMSKTEPFGNYLGSFWNTLNLWFMFFPEKKRLGQEIGNLFCGARQWCCSISGCFAATGWWCQPSMEGGIEGRATTTICAFGGWVQGGFYGDGPVCIWAMKITNQYNGN